MEGNVPNVGRGGKFPKAGRERNVQKQIAFMESSHCFDLRRLEEVRLTLINLFEVKK